MEFSVEAGLIFATVTAALAACGYILAGVFGRDASRVRERVASEFGRGPVTQRSALFKNLDELDLVPAEPSAAAETPGPRTRVGLRGRLETMIAQAGLAITPGRLLTIAAALGLGLGVAGAWFRGPLLGVTGAAAGSAAPLVFVHARRRARLEKLLRQLAPAFELMARVLRAGHSVPQSLQAVADAFEDPIAAEFAHCLKKQNLGLPPEETFNDMAERSGVLELRIFVMAMVIQRQAGGNLADVLERLATLIRERLKLRGRVRALTAEGRLQGVTLLILPFVLFAAMLFLNRRYAEVLLDQPGLLTIMGISMAVGVVWIRRIINFEA